MGLPQAILLVLLILGLHLFQVNLILPSDLVVQEVHHNHPFQNHLFDPWVQLGQISPPFPLVRVVQEAPFHLLAHPFHFYPLIPFLLFVQDIPADRLLPFLLHHLFHLLDLSLLLFCCLFVHKSVPVLLFSLDFLCFLCLHGMLHPFLLFDLSLRHFLDDHSAPGNLCSLSDQAVHQYQVVLEHHSFLAILVRLWSPSLQVSQRQALLFLLLIPESQDIPLVLPVPSSQVHQVYHLFHCTHQDHSCPSSQEDQ